MPTSTLPLIPFIGTLIISISVLVLVLDKTNVHIYRSAVVTMRAAPWMLVLLLVALHLQCLYTKYYLVETDGEAVSRALLSALDIHIFLCTRNSGRLLQL